MSEQLVWNDVSGLAQTSLETLGTYDIPDPDSDPNVPEYKSSTASAADVTAVQAIADGSGQLVILMMADDTGSTNYSGTWGDSETTYGGQPPQLLINGGAPASAAASSNAAVMTDNESIDVTSDVVDIGHTLPVSVSASPMSFDSSSRPTELANAALIARTFDELLLDRPAQGTSAEEELLDLVASAKHRRGSSYSDEAEWDESLLSVLTHDLE